MAKKPKKCITVDDARKLEKNYVKTIQKELLKDNKKMGYTDDRLIDYIGESATKLDHIIHDIVKKSAQNGFH